MARSMVGVVVLIAVFEFPKSSDAAEQNPVEAWTAYAHANLVAARDYIAPKFYGSLVSAVPPGSALARSLEPVDFDLYGDDARLNFRVPQLEFQPWIVMQRMDGRWKWTLDERHVLAALTPDWTVETVGGVLRYHSSSPLTDEQRDQAAELLATYQDYRQRFGFDPGVVEYYLAKEGAEAVEIVQETNKGAGTARYKALKAVGVASHKHELVHVFAMEVGMVNPFFDEGLATALGNAPLVADAAACKAVGALLEQPLRRYLDPSEFRRLAQQGTPVYPLAQLAMKLWLERQGLAHVLETIRLGIERPESATEIIDARHHLDSTQAELRRRIARCKRSLRIGEI